MKTRFIAVALAVLALAGCKSQTLEEKKAAYNEANEAIMTTYKTTIETAFADTTLNDEAKREAAMKAEETAIASLKDLALNTLKKNKDNELGVAALLDVYYDLELEEVEDAIATLSDEMQQDEKIVALAESIQAKKATAEGMMFTDFTVIQDPEKPESSTVSLSDYVGKGKYILVDFWASWCGPCKREIPNIKAVYEQYAGEKFDVLSVAVWDKPEDTVKSAEEHGVVWSQIINAQQIPTKIYGIEGIPHIILFGPDGTIVKRGLRGEGIADAVAEALGN